MQSPSRELAPTELPRILIFTTALTCGVLAALALQIYLSSLGYDIAAAWENSLTAKTLGPWWGVAGLAFVVSGATAAALSRLPLPWRRFRLLRWIAGAALVFALGHVGRLPGAPEEVAAGPLLLVNLVALAIATLMAMLGGYLTVRQ
jgi:branched-subunit amino acid ABC-type transport system permease component